MNLVRDLKNILSGIPRVRNASHYEIFCMFKYVLPSFAMLKNMILFDDIL